MKILHLINYYQPKIGYQEYFLAKKQRELGHEVFFITSDRYFPFKNYKKSYQSLLGPRIIKPGIFIEDKIIVYRLKPFLEIILPFRIAPNNVPSSNQNIILFLSKSFFNSFTILRTCLSTTLLNRI